MRPQFFIDSKIITDHKLRNQIFKFPFAIGYNKNLKVYGFKLIYRGSIHGFKPIDFHRNCDNNGPILVIVKSKSSGKMLDSV